MATDSDIYRTAGLMVKEFGQMAPIGAKVKADQMSDRGDTSARSVWLRVARATEELLSETRDATAPLN